MKSILNHVPSAKKTSQLDFSSVLVVYQVEKNLWRGFIMPLDVTGEAESKEQVTSILEELTSSYIDGLETYGNPSHLSDVPLSNILDVNKWSKISQDLTNKLLNKISEINTPDYYAKAQLPS